MRRDAGGFFGPATTAGHEGDRDIPRGTKKENQGPPRATKGHQGGSRYGVLGKSLNIGGMGLI